MPFTVEDGVSSDVQFDVDQIAAFQKHKVSTRQSGITVCILEAHGTVHGIVWPPLSRRVARSVVPRNFV